MHIDSEIDGIKAGYPMHLFGTFVYFVDDPMMLLVNAVENYGTCRI